MGKKEKKKATPKKKEKIKVVILFLVFAAGALAMFIAGIAKAISASPYWALLSLAGVVAGIINVCDYVSNRRQIRHTYCKQCGEHFDYESDVQWEESNFGISSFTDNKGTTTTAKSTVEFRCVCHNCGSEQSFRKKFAVGKIDPQGRLSTSSLSTQIKRYFK